jgi:hypothetical protein
LASMVETSFQFPPSYPAAGRNVSAGDEQSVSWRRPPHDSFAEAGRTGWASSCHGRATTVQPPVNDHFMPAR